MLHINKHPEKESESEQTYVEYGSSFVKMNELMLARYGTDGQVHLVNEVIKCEYTVA